MPIQYTADPRDGINGIDTAWHDPPVELFGHALISQPRPPDYGPGWGPQAPPVLVPGGDVRVSPFRRQGHGKKRNSGERGLIAPAELPEPLHLAGRQRGRGPRLPNDREIVIAPWDTGLSEPYLVTSDPFASGAI